MIESNDGPSRSRTFSPFLAPGERRELHELLTFVGPTPPTFAEGLRTLARSYIDDGDSGKLRAVCLLVADLFEQGWSVEVAGDRIMFEPPGIGGRVRGRGAMRLPAREQQGVHQILLRRVGIDDCDVCADWKVRLC